MQLRSYLDPALVFVGLQPSDKDSLLQELAERIAKHLSGVDGDDLRRRLKARERESSTGVGQGIAIPHTFLDVVDQTVCVLAQVPGGVEFDAIDEVPVRLLFMLLSPSASTSSHLRLLARISRVAGREGFAADAAAASSAEALLALVTTEDESHVG